MIHKASKLRALAAAAWHRRHALVWVLYATGIAWFCLLPLLAQDGSLDEKALLLGIARPSWRDDAMAVASQARRLGAASPSPGITTLEPLVGAAARAAAGAGGGPLRWHSTRSGSGCSASYTVAPASRGDGTEGLALVLPLHLSNGPASALAATIGATAAQQLAAAPWLAKDVAVVLLDAHRCSALAATEAWLAALESTDNSSAAFAQPSPGQLQQALVLDVASTAAAAVTVGMHGHGGQLPNADFVFLVKRILDYYVGLPVGLDVGAAPAYHVKGAPAAPGAFVAEVATAAAFAAQLASGRPTGAHAAFLRRGIDSISLTLGSRDSGNTQNPAGVQQTCGFALAAAEMVLRTCNNLQERLHHATPLYLLVTPEKQVNVGAFMAAPALLLLAAVLQAASWLAAAQTASLHDWQQAWGVAIGVHGTLALAALAAWGGVGWPVLATVGAGCAAAVRWGQAWMVIKQCAGGRKSSGSEVLGEVVRSVGRGAALQGSGDSRQTPSAGVPGQSREAPSPAPLVQLKGGASAAVALFHLGLAVEAAAALLWRWTWAYAGLALLLPACWGCVSGVSRDFGCYSRGC